MTTCYYVDRKFTGDRLSAVLAGLDDGFGVTVKARIENTLIIESYDEDNICSVWWISVKNGRRCSLTAWMNCNPFIRTDLLCLSLIHI